MNPSQMILAPARETVPLSVAYRQLEKQVRDCPIESGFLMELADFECPHQHLPSDRRITCDCWGPR